jgi:hypothetical protein
VSGRCILEFEVVGVYGDAFCFRIRQKGLPSLLAEKCAMRRVYGTQMVGNKNMAKKEAEEWEEKLVLTLRVSMSMYNVCLVGVVKQRTPPEEC